MDTVHRPSLALTKANARLLALRQQEQPQNNASSIVATPVATVDDDALYAKLPAHLGWESTRITQIGRRTTNHQPATTNDQSPTSSHQRLTGSSQPPTTNQKQPATNDFISIYPSLAVGMLKEGEVSAGRLWWLCRHLDRQGQGWIRIADARKQFTSKASSLKFCGWRRLRQILASGNGLFWTRDKDRIWLRSTPKVAAALNVANFQGDVVAMPAKTFCQNIATVRAHLYATFHVGRGVEERKAGRAGGKKKTLFAAPIARETLAVVTGVGRRSQRAYEENAGISVQQNIAIGNLVGDRQHEMAAKYGTAYFTFTDYRGQGKKYEAWQLPNSYSGSQQRLGRGRQKYLNQHLNDLRMKREAGNGQQEVVDKRRRFYQRGTDAGKVANRQPQRDIYWRRERSQSGKGLWYGLPAF